MRKVLALVVLAFAVAACGDDDPPAAPATTAGRTTTTTAATIDKDEFIEMADAICADANDELDAIESPEQGDFQDLVRFIDEVLPLLEDRHEQLAALPRPDEDAEDFEELLDSSQAQIDTARDLREAAEDEDEARVQELLGELGERADSANEQAKEFGFEACADED